tara:strand:- start:616 stop:981 length:366 start_codon:yes stop_codon:yes gene_type:complete
MLTTEPTTLRNGATVLARHPSKSLGCGDVVLCQSGAEFVTWVLDSEGHAHWGHYHPTRSFTDQPNPVKAALQRAVGDFLDRIVEPSNKEQTAEIMLRHLYKPVEVADKIISEMRDTDTTQS